MNLTIQPVEYLVKSLKSPQEANRFSPSKPN